MEVTKGTRIFNHGDMANWSHFGTITKITTDRWGTHLHITPDNEEGSERGSYTVSMSMLSKEYRGHSGTRIVTEDVYNKWRKDGIDKIINKMERRAT